MSQTALKSVPSNARWAEARRAAQTLTAGYTAPPIPVLEIAESNGVDVVFDTFDGYADSVAGFCDFAGAKIYVNGNDPVRRQTFTIAHELGHWLLHRDLFATDPQRYQVLPRFQQPDASDVLEQEANCFAANLLVPAALLRPVKNAGVSRLADMFGVSKQMMENRLKDKRV
jgi:Zn-dependent peptidase ImmA (M78 family)